MSVPSILQRSFIPAVSKQLVSDGYSPFTIAQFNVLADYLSDAFPHTDPKVLTWGYRKQLLIDEILQHKSDIVCLEECDHFEDHFKPHLESVGYGSLFKKKIDKKAKDGCAFFWNTKKFELLDHQLFEMGAPNSQVAIIAKLRLLPQTPQQKSLELCVAMVHMKAKVGFEDMRLAQGAKLLSAVQSFVNINSVPVIIVGDFNDVPQNPVHLLFSTGKAVSSTGQLYSSEYKLQNAYDRYDETGIPPYTTYKKREVEVVRTIDYIWHSNQLAVTKCLEIPLIEKLVDRLPCALYPSDHLFIAAEFHVVQ